MQRTLSLAGFCFPRLLLIGLVGQWLLAGVAAQEPAEQPAEPERSSAPAEEEFSPAATRVDVRPVARDEEIRERLQSVLETTDWFGDPRVEVRQGVVFLNGQAESEELKQWAGNLARNTQDVVAVANRIEVVQPSVWDFTPAWRGLKTLWRDLVRSLPLLLFGLLVLLLSIWAGGLVSRGADWFLRSRIRVKLLRTVVARAGGVLVVLSGVYIILRVSGLTQLALTVVGGTGLLGLVLGIAFRDITENFLASIFLSMQRPFETGDLVEITGVTGYVQQMNIRTTILMTLPGNLIQIPNASVYKSNILNFTTNVNRREDFVVGIGYGDSIVQAQETARKVLEEHPAVLDDPEPSVLADSLGTSTVNLRVYFWLNGREHSWLKVRSSVIRLVKLAFQQNGISMPDEASEIVFPKGVPVTGLKGKPDAEQPGTSAPRQEPDIVSTKAEAGLYSEGDVIREQARQVQPLQAEENLLESGTGSSASRKNEGGG